MEILTEREQEVYKLVCMGKSNKEIGEQMNISVHTVKAHVSTILKKLGVSNRISATYIAGRDMLV